MKFFQQIDRLGVRLRDTFQFFSNRHRAAAGLSAVAAATMVAGCQTMPTIQGIDGVAEVARGAPVSTAQDPNKEHRAQFDVATPMRVWGALMINARGDSSTVFDNWSEMKLRHEASLKKPQSKEMFDKWLSQFDHMKTLSLEQKVKSVDSVIDGLLTYTPDKELYGAIEYWATPLETLTYLKGDCEDFSALKYYTLRYLGVPASKIFLTALDAPAGFQDHSNLMVDLCETDCENDQEKEKRDVVMLDEADGGNFVQKKYRDYKLIMTMNENSLWGNFDYAHKGDFISVKQRAPMVPKKG